MAKIIENMDAMAELDAVENKVKSGAAVPNGYIKIELSTMGLAGAPAEFHIRNLDTNDVLGLALAEAEELPIKLIEMLNGIIYEDIDVKDFHEKEVVELLVRLYQAFYGNDLVDVDFPWDERDLEVLKARLSDTEYLSQKADLDQRRWVPKTNINLGMLETYDLDPKTFKTEIFITPKGTEFTFGFSIPRFGDVVVLRDFLLKHYKEQDKRFASIREILKFRRDAETRVRGGEDIALGRIPNITDSDREAFKEYETEKSMFGMTAIKALHLTFFDGEDVSKKPLTERIKMAEDPRLDLRLMKKVNGYFDDLKLGLQDDVMMYNPITNINEKRSYSFRLMDILQAIKLHESDDYDIDFESPLSK